MKNEMRDNALDIEQFHWKKENDRKGDTSKVFQERHVSCTQICLLLLKKMLYYLYLRTKSAASTSYRWEIYIFLVGKESTVGVKNISNSLFFESVDRASKSLPKKGIFRRYGTPASLSPFSSL